MSHAMKVLKAMPAGTGKAGAASASSLAAAASRILLRGAPVAIRQPSAPSGTWLTDTALEAFRRDSFDQGFEKGLLEGREQAEATMRAPLQREAAAQLQRELARLAEEQAHREAHQWTQLVTRLRDQVDALHDRLLADVTEWTFAATVRLLGFAAPASVSAAVRQVLDEAGLAGPIAIHLHPQDLQRLQADGGLDSPSAPDGMKWMADEAVGLGGCLIESPIQTVDARLEVQLRLLRQALDAARSTIPEGARS